VSTDIEGCGRKVKKKWEQEGKREAEKE